jgi:hypothetical protein
MPPWPLVPAWCSSVARPLPVVCCHANGLQEPSVVEPIDPFKGGELDSLEVSPWSAPVDRVETVDGFVESVVIGISDNKRLYACFGQALAVFDDVLLPRSLWCTRPPRMDRPSIMQCLLQRVEHQAGVRRARDPPAATLRA